MKIETLKIKDLKTYDKNARIHPQKQIDLLAKNIEKFGFTTPVLIDKNNEIIAGHGRIVAMQKLGKDEVPCVRMEKLTEEEVKALRLADNQLAQMAEWDMGLAIDELKGLSDEMVELTGWDKNDLEGIENAEQISELAKERDLDLGQYDVLTVEAPEAPRLKARVSFYTRNIDEFNKLKEFFNAQGGVLDVDKLLSLING